MEMRTPHFYFSFNCSLVITLTGITISIPLLRSLTLQELPQWTTSPEPSVDGKWTVPAWKLKPPAAVSTTRDKTLKATGPPWFCLAPCEVAWQGWERWGCSFAPPRAALGGVRGQLPHPDKQTGVPPPGCPPSSTTGSDQPWATASALPASTPSPWKQKSVGCPNWQHCICTHQQEQEVRWSSNVSPGKGSPPAQAFVITSLSREVFLLLLKHPCFVCFIKSYCKNEKM